MNLLAACRQTARRIFRIQSLRPEQEAAMLAVLKGRDVLAALPTGFGKSLIYQVPAMIFERPTIVISPLIALMADQESALRRCGVPVVALHSQLRAADRRGALDRLKAGGRLVVLTTPETLESAATAALFEQAQAALLCVDEAHSISEWGHDFRPSYLRLGQARQRLGYPPALALTATATPRVRADIAERLRLNQPTVLVAPAHRPNLRLSVNIVPGAEKFRAAARRIRALRRPGIIYCATTTAVDEVGGALKRAGIPVARYHGKMRAADRAAAQRQYMQRSRRLIMVATSAFGMGIDKPNIRYILHYQAPGSLEQYVQEIGRAGRDGHPAQCILLFDPADLEIQERLQSLSRPSIWHLERLESALTAWATENRAPSAATLAYSAGVPARIGEVLLLDLEEAGLIERDQEGGIIVIATESFKAGVGDLMAKLKTFRYEGERRLRLIAEYAQSQDCRSQFIRRYFGEEDPPRCGTCDRCRADRVVAATATVPPRERRPRSRRRVKDAPRRPAKTSPGARR
ncbi:MAG TPA: RecQ family ATP-dependent DNA helicase [Hyphomicrobiaceae bacterium]|nr:RecQ family ATP-dependent DNA helicase [Hyphomicrobiaceae bacterium]